MSTSIPTVDQAEALHAFVQDRNNDEWQRALTDTDLSEDQYEATRRLTNSNRLALAVTAAYLLNVLDQGDREQAILLWDHLTTCGEQWETHENWRAEWANPARAALR